MEYSLVVPPYLSSTISDFQIHMKAIRNDFHLSKAEDFKGLLESDSYTDVRFICRDGEAVTCHGSILATVSPMLKEWMLSYIYNPEKYFSILLPDVPGGVMKSFVQLLYGCTLFLGSGSETYASLESLCGMLNIESKRVLGNKKEGLPLCCWRCGASFSLLGDLKNHVASKHFGEKIKATKRHRCTKCRKVLPSMWKLRQHLLTHKPEGNRDHMYAEPRPSRRSMDHPYANPSDHPYSSKRKTTSATRSSSSKAVASLHSYAAAAQEEEEEAPSPPEAAAPFSCTRCSKTFPKKYRLNRHVEEVHDQVKKFKCPSCSKAFFKKTSLTRHALTHQSDPLYACEHCSKKFKDPSGLKYHVSKGVCLRKESSSL